MASDSEAAVRLRSALAGLCATREVRMFGGICFMARGNMLCGSGWEGLLFRVGKDQHDIAVSLGAKPMMQRGRQLRGYVWVSPTVSERQLADWISMARRYVDTLPPKRKRAGRRPP